MEKLFDNKVALLTGAASGIGQAAAILYARYGAKVVVSDINEEGGNETVAMIQKEGGDASFIKADISKAADCKNLIADTIGKYGRLDAACNNAGIGGEQGPVSEMSTENWHKVIGINLTGVFYCMKYEIEAMKNNGGGAIVNISSILGSVGFQGAAAYVAAKHGVVGLTRAAALDHAADNVRVNAIGPAFIDTPLISSMKGEALEMLKSLHPMGRLGTSEEVGELITWLTSSKASFATGSYYPLDGGYLAR